jgi:spore maturation protein CgeB
MRILYLGSKNGTSGHRAKALRRLQHEVDILDFADILPKLPLLGTWERYLGSVGLASLLRTRVLKRLAGNGTFDLVWVDSGALVSRELVEDLKRFGKRVLNYITDDPYGSRDLNLWHQYRRAVSAYDLVVVVRKENEAEAHSLGARRVLRVYFSADEIAHEPFHLNQEERANWTTDVLFVGTAFPERGPFFAKLVSYGVPVSIFGNRWQRLKQWKTIRPYWKGPGLVERHTYAAAIMSAKVCLGLLSKGNRDLHTQRSLEIPSLGSVFCAERTEEHLELYKEDEEAVFWSNAEECARKCHALLADDKWRESLAERGRLRFLKNGWTNMKVAERILDAVSV